MKSKPQPTFLRLQISEDAKTALERQAARHGMSQTEIASRLVGWLVRQSQSVQAAVLNNINPGRQQDLAPAFQLGTRKAGVGASAGTAIRRSAKARRK